MVLWTAKDYKEAFEREAARIAKKGGVDYLTAKDLAAIEFSRDFRRRLAAGRIGEAPFAIRQRELAKKRSEMG